MKALIKVIPEANGNSRRLRKKIYNETEEGKF